MTTPAPDGRSGPGSHHARPTQAQPGEGSWGRFRRDHVRAARLIAFGPLVLVVSLLVLLLGLPWWTLLVTFGGLAFVLLFLS
jgi:hypothetical protein